jgi:hypothetical protein
MVVGRELRNLELRRRELVLRSTLHRLEMGQELEHIQAALRPAERVIHSLRALRPWLVVLAPLAGLLAARGFRNNGSGFSKLLAVFKWIPPLLSLWKQFETHSTAPAPDTPRWTGVPK